MHKKVGMPHNIKIHSAIDGVLYVGSGNVRHEQFAVKYCVRCNSVDPCKFIEKQGAVINRVYWLDLEICRHVQSHGVMADDRKCRRHCPGKPQL